MTKKPWAHFIAVCGPSVAGIAILMKNKGWKVTGSDKNSYQPAGKFLEANGVEIQLGFDSKRINKKIDLVVLGGAAIILDKDNPEVSKAEELNLIIKGWPEVASEEIAKEESIVVAGTYGKTTTTAMIAFVLREAGLNPSYLIGDFANNFNTTVYSSDSNYSVMEGDEHPSVLHYDNKSKFLYYKPKYVVLTSAKWDHYNVFPKENDYIRTYINLVKLIPKDGLLIASKSGGNIKKIIKHARCRVIRYEKSDYKGVLSVIGDFNLENAAAVLSLATNLGISIKRIHEILKRFSGVKRRLEKKFEAKGLLVIEDFAQHPFKIKNVLETLKRTFPSYKLITVIDPNASILRSKLSLPFFKGSMDRSDIVIVRRMKVAFDRDQRITGPDLVNSLGLPKNRVFYVPIDEEIVNLVLDEAKSTQTLVLFCSSGDWHGLIERTIKALS